MLSFLKRNHDFLLLLLAFLIYTQKLSWFPFLFAMILYVWYRREVLWRVKHKKPFFHGKVADANAKVMGNRVAMRLFLFFIYGFVWVLLVAFILHFLNLAVYVSFIFEYTFKYLYTGFSGTEVYLNKKFLLHRYLLVLITIYAVYYGREIILLPWYDYCIHIQKGGKNLLYTISRGFVGFRLLLAIGAIWLMGYWAIFQMPIFALSCSTGTKLITCISIEEGYYFFRFMFRYFFWWTVFLFLLGALFYGSIYKDGFGTTERALSL
ncbi:hypothetical protein [Stenoxybacter acetivorans]|uniref:hypothetical protein n=1 Tax=Stenoxybacter acetivorans TaxID=422441 RepID=UPI00056B27DB|nr:hypothetical protein [Stenoxybacter acetivorans]